MESIHYQLEPQLSAEEFQQVLQDSGLDQRRPAQDLARLDRMLRGSNLILTARDGASLVGIARSVTDSAYCCYLSDLAVSRRLQGRGIGRELIEQTRRTVGPEVSIILHAAPAAVAFYEKIGMPRMPDSFWYKRER
jgi:GNAT superfamily N-acetyltransferase